MTTHIRTIMWCVADCKSFYIPLAVFGIVDGKEVHPLLILDTAIISTRKYLELRKLLRLVLQRLLCFGGEGAR